jgi:predicted DNA binding CopG/RHH family protein
MTLPPIFRAEGATQFKLRPTAWVTVEEDLKPQRSRVGIIEKVTHDSSDYLNWGNAQKAIFPNLKASTSHISLRLPQSLLEKLKAAANARDVPYQSMMKIWLAEKVAENSFPRSSSRLKQSKS